MIQQAIAYEQEANTESSLRFKAASAILKGMHFGACAIASVANRAVNKIGSTTPRSAASVSASGACNSPTLIGIPRLESTDALWGNLLAVAKSRHALSTLV